MLGGASFARGISFVLRPLMPVLSAVYYDTGEKAALEMIDASRGPGVVVRNRISLWKVHLTQRIYGRVRRL